MTPSDLPAAVHAVEQSVAANICTSGTVDELRYLLGISTALNTRQPTTTVSKGRRDAAKPPVKTKRSATKSHPAAARHCEVGPLDTAARTTLATKIINSSLKALTVIVREQTSKNDPPQRIQKGGQPLQPLSPNNQSAALQLTKLSRASNPRTSSQNTEQANDHVVSLAECSRAAFEFLRQTNQSKNVAANSSCGQIELGMSSFIGKLLALGMDSLASKELISLLSRLRARSDTSKAARVKAVSAAQRDPLLADLLSCNALPDDAQALEILITSHVQVLKLSSKTPKVSTTERALYHLDGSGVSVLTAIEKLVALNSQSLILKASKWLDQIAQSLDALAAIKTTPEASIQFFHTAFRCRTLACRVRLRSWRLNNTGRSLHRHVLDPFTAHTSAFALARNSSSAEKYTTIKQGTHLFLEELARATKPQLPTDSYDLTSAKVYRVLADVGRESQNFNIAYEWLEKALQIPSTSSCLKCALACLLASTHIQQNLSGCSTNSLSKVLRNASEQLKTNLQGSTTDMDDVFVSAASLRKQAVSMLVRDSSGADSFHSSEAESTSGLCKEVVLRCVKFFIRYAQGVATHRKDQLERQQERQYGLVAKSLVPTVEALAAVTNMVLPEETTLWEDIMQCLQECQALTTNFDNFTAKTSPSQQKSRHPSVTISNAFWCRYLKRKSQVSKYNELMLLLKRAIDALSSCSPLEQDTGFLYLKYEKLGSLLESQEDLDKASLKYAAALRAILNFPSAVGSFNNTDPFLEITSKPQTGCLARLRPLIASYLRVQAKLTASFGRDFIAFHPQLQSIADGCMLELQLTAALESLQGDLCLVPSGSLNILYALLKESYAESTVPSHRVHLKLLHGLCIAPTCYSEGFFEILQRNYAALSSRMVEKDEVFGLLREQHDMYMVLLQRESGISRISTILSSWQRQVKCAEHLSDRTSTLASPEFLDQLRLLQDYLCFNGNEVSRAQVTDILMLLQKTTSSASDLVQCSAVLAQQLTRLGHCELARKQLSQTEHIVENAAHETQMAAIDWHLAYSEYLLDIGNTESCHERLRLTEKLSMELWAADGGAASSLWDRYQQLCYTAQILHLNASLDKATGNPARALYHAKKSTRLIHRAWAVMERYQSAKMVPETNQAAALNTKPLPDASPEGAPVNSTEHISLQQASFWTLGPLLFAHTAKLAYILADEGQLLEARYYTEKVEKVAQAIGSARLLAEATILKVSLARLGGEVLPDVSSLQKIAAEPFGLCYSTHADVELALAEALHKNHQPKDEVQALKHVELILAKGFQHPLDLLSQQPSEIDAIHQGMAVLTIQSEPKARDSRAPVKNGGRKPKKDVKASEAPSKSDTANRNEKTEHGPIIRRQGRRLRQSAMLSMKLNDFDLAATVLQEANKVNILPVDSANQSLCNIALSIGQAVAVFAKDPVFSLVQESSIMHPSVPLDKVVEATIVSIASTSGKGGKPVASVKESREITKSPATHDGVVALLNTSTQCLLRASKNMQPYLNTALGHTCSDSLIKAQLLLSVAASAYPKAAVTPRSLAYSLEYGRCLAYMREGASIVADRVLDAEKDATMVTNHELLSGEFDTSHIDVSSFQSSFVDILPPQWSVISISVSSDHEELRISRMRTCHPPMTLSIPLSRHNPRDCDDEEPFGFNEGKSELLEIISLANYSAHESVDLTKKGAKTAWWETRAALDARLNDLVNNIQNMWIGGFQGIFSQHVPSLDLLARFQTTLNNIMNKHLPSRQRTRKGAASQPVCLDTQVLGLFIGLGHPATHPDLDTALLDLFYFIVDILQFHGERNAYDEIEFDPMILETHEALTHYHNAADELQDSDLPKHTILVLDKCLHAFPWESLPCLAGQSISRVPSLSCLRDRILMQQEQGSNLSAFEANISSGSYILNPSGDLASTHKTFASPLSGLTNWDATVKTLPTETDITAALSSKSLYLYFGHGSGAQYVRSRAIRKLKQCAVALLMGCSSGSLIEAGEMESHGPLMAYLHAGSPAVVGTLWDVTDKDIDRFALNTLQRWGLFEAKPEGGEKGKGRKGKGKTPAEPALAQKPVSLDQAVAESRQSCILKYLNGAAPVVYGIPVVLK